MYETMLNKARKSREETMLGDERRDSNPIEDKDNTAATTATRVDRVWARTGSKGTACPAWSASGHLSLEGAVRSMGVAVTAVATLCRRLVDARGRGHGGGSGGRVEGRDGVRG